MSSQTVFVYHKMDVQMMTALPAEYKSQKGKTYETKYIYTGLRRYDTQRKTLSHITQTKPGILHIDETPCTNTVFSRAYHTELVRVTVYSESPRVWKEELSPHETYFFVQQLTQAL